MPGKISELPVATSLGSTDTIEVLQSGSNKSLVLQNAVLGVSYALKDYRKISDRLKKHLGGLSRTLGGTSMGGRDWLEMGDSRIEWAKSGGYRDAVPFLTAQLLQNRFGLETGGRGYVPPISGNANDETQPDEAVSFASTSNQIHGSILSAQAWSSSSSAGAWTRLKTAGYRSRKQFLTWGGGSASASWAWFGFDGTDPDWVRKRSRVTSVEFVARNGAAQTNLYLIDVLPSNPVAAGTGAKVKYSTTNDGNNAKHWGLIGGLTSTANNVIQMTNGQAAQVWHGGYIAYYNDEGSNWRVHNLGGYGYVAADFSDAPTLTATLGEFTSVDPTTTGAVGAKRGAVIVDNLITNDVGNGVTPGTWASDVATFGANLAARINYAIARPSLPVYICEIPFPRADGGANQAAVDQRWADLVAAIVATCATYSQHVAVLDMSAYVGYPITDAASVTAARTAIVGLGLMDSDGVHENAGGHRVRAEARLALVDLAEKA